MTWWQGLLIDIAFTVFVALIAIFYNWIWYDLFQRFEPWTAQFARIAQKRPWLWYSGCVLFLLGLVAGIILVHEWWWRYIIFIVGGFMGWFIPHVAAAAADPDNPPHLPTWSFMARVMLERRVSEQKK